MSVPVMSRFKIFHKFEAEFHVAEGKSGSKHFSKEYGTPRQKRPRAIIDSFG